MNLGNLLDFDFWLKKIKDLQPDRLRTPVILQMEAAECGAAALTIILAHYGRYISLEEARVACGVSRDGSKASNIVAAARSYGLKAQGAQVQEVDALLEIQFPLIAFWEFNHFVVVEAIEDGKVYINDPAQGPCVLSIAEFSRSFTGIVLIFEPEPDFKKQGALPSITESLKERLLYSKDALLYVILISLALVIPGMIIPGFAKIFIDDVLIRGIDHWFVPLVLGMGLTACMRAGLDWLQKTYLLRLQVKLLLTSSANFLWHILRLPISFFSQRFAGDIVERITANDRIADLLSTELTSSAVSIISMFFFVFVMLLLSLPLTLIGVSAALLNFALLYYVAQKIAVINRRLLQEQGKLSGIETNGLRIIETLKSTASEGIFFKRWAGAHARTINSQQAIMLYNQLLLIVPALLSGLTTVIIIGVGGWQIMSGVLTVGTLVAFQSLLASFNAPLQTLLGLAENVQKIRGDMIRLDDVLRHPHDPRLTYVANASKQDKLITQIDIKNLTFGYSKLAEPIIEGFNMILKPGSRVALIGTTGSGKTTISRLICGLYEPWAGQVLYDNQPYYKVSNKLAAGSIALVDQDIFLFEGTIQDNLTLWNKHVDHQRIIQALHDACINDIIDIRGGLNSHVAENGTNFSGGQRQRIEIARALVNNPSLLIMDEATSSLDTISEKLIYENLQRRECTLLIISHRLSAIRDCDEILVLERGKIIQRGTHAQLAKTKGRYCELIALE